MAKYGLVAGEKANDVLVDMINKFDDMEVTYQPKTMEKMILDLTNTGGLILQDLKAVIIMDYAFDFGEKQTDIDKIAIDFVSIQDLMQTNRLDGVTLYLLTRNTDLYDKLRGKVEGLDGIYFDNVQVLLTTEQYRADLLKAVLLGERDRQGLYNKNVQKNKTRTQLLEEEGEHEQKSRQNLSKDFDNIENWEPETTVTNMDYIDSDEKKIQNAEEERDRKEEEKRKDRGKKRNKGAGGEKQEEQEEQEGEGKGANINIYKGGSSGRELEGEGYNPTRKEYGSEKSVEDERLKEVFKEIKNTKTGVARGKIETDQGVISVVGDYGSGASGIVANAAEMYAMSKKKVLIIDLDIQNRMQTTYFNQYDKVVKSQRGSADSLIEVIQGYGIDDSVVPITKYLHILSVSRDEDVNLRWVNSAAGGLDIVITEAKSTYDIILIDIPFRFFKNYINIFNMVDKNIFVVENKFYKFENFLENIINPLLLDKKVLMEDIIIKSDIVLNKFERGRMDQEGREINRRYVRRYLDGAGYPYDSMGVIGEIPYYDDWEEQFYTGLRYVWKDDVAMGVYRRVFGKVVI